MTEQTIAKFMIIFGSVIVITILLAWVMLRMLEKGDREFMEQENDKDPNAKK